MGPGVCVLFGAFPAFEGRIGLAGEQHPDGAFRDHQPSTEREPFRGREGCSGDRHIEALSPIRELFAPIAEHGDVRSSERPDDGAEKGHPLLQRLDEGQGQIRAKQREAQARSPSPRAYVHDPRTGLHRSGEDNRVGDHQIHELAVAPRGGQVDAGVPRGDGIEPAPEMAEGCVIDRGSERRRCLRHERIPPRSKRSQAGHERMTTARSAAELEAPPVFIGGLCPNGIDPHQLPTRNSEAPLLELSFSPVLDLVRRIAVETTELSAAPMPGGASTRRFFRVELGPSRGTAVAMFVPDGARPEEIDKTCTRARRWPFLEVRDLLAERGIRVPAILGEATSEGWLLLEDLGDDTIAQFLLREPSRRVEVYKLAIAELARAQRILADLPDDSIVKTRAFDEDLLRWEIDHFREWALEARGIHLTASDRATFDTAADRLARKIASWPRGFVHRDYQSRNLMVLPSQKTESALELGWIDFQDALLGPRVYDLVALLSDSYQQMDADFIRDRLDEYAEHMGLGEQGRAEIQRELDYVTVQRKLKDAGRFVFIDRTKNNPSFLSFVEPTIAKARAALARLHDDEDMRALAAVLDRALPSI